MSGQRTHWAEQLATELRSRAALFSSHGDDGRAQMCEHLARELEERRRAWEDEELTNVEAAAECGYTPQALGLLRRQGKWSGRRGDLPRHAGGRSTPILSAPSATRSIAERALMSHTGASPRRRRVQ